MKKYLAGLFTAVLLTLCLVPAVAVADGDQSKSSDGTIVLNNVPVNLKCGAFPQQGTKLTFDEVEIPAGLILDSSNSYFYMRPDRVQSGNHFYTDGICNSGTVYGVQIALCVMDGYAISPDATYSLSGLPISGVRTVEHPDGKTRYIFSREFERTSGATDLITAGLIHDLEQPIVGKTPRQQYGSLMEGENVKFQVTTKIDDFSGSNVVEVAQLYYKKFNASTNKWDNMNLDEAFATDGRYRMDLLLSPQHWVGGTYYEMASSFTITVNGTDFTGRASTAGGFAFNYEFEPVTTLDHAEATVVEPQVGAVPSYSVTVPEGAHYTASVNWAETHDGTTITTFGNNRYTAYVTFHANDGFTFVNGFDMLNNVTINGQQAVRKAHDSEHKWITFEVSFICGEAPDWIVQEVALYGVPAPTPGEKMTLQYLRFNSSATEAKAYIDPLNTYCAYWNPSTKSWFAMKEGDVFQEGVLYRVQVSIKARSDQGYMLHPNATGSLRHMRFDDPVVPEIQFVTEPEECLFLSLTFNDIECTSFGGHRYTDRWHTDDSPSAICLNTGCGYHYGDVNRNGVLNIVDAQIAYDLAHGQGGYENSSEYSALLNRADVMGGPTLRTGDKTVDASDVDAIQYAVLWGW